MDRKTAFEMLNKYSLSYILFRFLNKVKIITFTFFSTFWFVICFYIKGGRVGKFLEVYGKVILRFAPGTIEIGNNVQLISSSYRCTASAINHPVRLVTFFPNAKIIISDGCGLNGTSITCRSSQILIGKNVKIAPNVTIIDSDFHAAWPVESRSHYTGTEYDSPVEIQDNVWIGMNCIVLKGVVIGKNSVIGAGSVVIKSIPPNCLAAGNPATVKKEYQ